MNYKKVNYTKTLLHALEIVIVLVKNLLSN